MKITITEPGEGEEDEIIVRCRHMDQQLLKLIYAVKAGREKITALQAGNYFQVAPEEIYYFEAVDNKVFLYLEKEVYETRMKLYELQEIFQGTDFFRASKSCIVNLSKVKRLRDVAFVFVCVTTCVLAVTALYITVFWQQAVLGVEILWQILGVSFLCSLVAGFYPQREIGKKALLCIYVCHYVLTNAIVLGCGIWFEWFYLDNLPMVLAMLLAIAAIFVFVSAVVWRRGKKQAELMNERLRLYQQENR